MSVLDVPMKQAYRSFLHLCSTLPNVDVEHVDAWTQQRIRNIRHQSLEEWPLERQWYASLENGGPDWSVYDTDAYLAELWACWQIYARSYLIDMRKAGMLQSESQSVVADIGQVKVVVDLGCGFGYSTAALAQLFPGAKVYGTNLDDTKQMRLARIVGTQYGFEMKADVDSIGHVDVIFASEYFEHVPDPLDHLQAILGLTTPRVLLIANAFTSASVGHFPTYQVDGEALTGKVTSKRFNDTLRTQGYTKVKTLMWNNRPSYWKLA